jgi:hypothetical protein
LSWGSNNLNEVASSSAVKINPSSLSGILNSTEKFASNIDFSIVNSSTAAVSSVQD